MRQHNNCIINSSYIQIKINNHPTYTLDVYHFLPGGYFYGPNFITALCVGRATVSPIVDSTMCEITQYEDVYVVHAPNDAIDYLFYIWQMCRCGVVKASLVTDDKCKLIKFYSKNSFPKLAIIIDKVKK